MRIIYLDLDALRPDHLGCYGYHRNTSPNIDRLASEGTVFRNVYCSDAPCLPSRTAFYTGQMGIHTGVVGHGGTAAEPFVQGYSRGFRGRLDESTLPMVLQRAGYYTAQISPFGQRHSARHFFSGFREILNTGGDGIESAEDVTPVVEKWLNEHAASDNWFLHVNYWDIHTPYRVPMDYGEPFAHEPLPEWLTNEVFESHRNHVGPHSAQEIDMWTDQSNPDWPRYPGRLDTMADVRKIIDGYDTAIRYVDEAVGKLVAALEAMGVLDQTAIVISADHGENLGELGIYSEHATADAITCRVPMIVRWPGRAGAIANGLHYHLDFAPSLLGLLGMDAATPAAWDGQSFAGAVGVGDSGDAGAREDVVISQCAHVCQRSVRFRQWLFTKTYHCGGHLFPEHMLYDLEADPYEQNNLAEQHPEICQEGLARLQTWVDKAMRTSNSNIDPLWTVMREGGPFHARGELARYSERLLATGRGWAVDELRRRYPAEFAQ
jgi:arylsulfatase A-like enzyme